jgi:putative membrane protein
LSSLDFGTWLYLLLGGILAAVALVVPGISGSMILMILGLYTPILIVLSDLLHFQNIFSNIMICLPIGLGVIIGFFSIAKLMGFLLKKHPINTYFLIIGFVIGSIFTIYYVTITDSEYTIDFSLPSILISIVCLIGGFLLTYLLEKKISKPSKEEEKCD